MKKGIVMLIFVFGFWGFGKAQQTIEEQVADTACLCFSNADSTALAKNANAVKMQCLNDAIAKNNEEIIKNYATEKRKEDDQEKMGIGGSLLIKVQNVLVNSCPAYAKFEAELRQQRQSGKARR